jgi:hypothetical protein
MTARKYNKLNETQWAEARTLWESGEPTLNDLADHFGVTTRTLQAHFHKHATVKGAKAPEIAIRVHDAVIEDAIGDLAERQRLGKQARARTVANMRAIESLAMQQIETMRSDPATTVRASATLRALALAAQVIERAQSTTWTALGIERSDQTEELPRIVVECLSDQQIREWRDRSDVDLELHGRLAPSSVPAADDGDPGADAIIFEGQRADE